MSMAPLGGMDLNLLITLQALLREENVTRAARALGTTQPTVSRALATLRKTFNDPLLVRTGRGMELTPYSHALITPLEQVLAGINRLRGVGEFDPATAQRRFRLHIPDILGCGILSDLQTLLQPLPGLGLDVLGKEGEGLEALLNSATDLVVGVNELNHANLYTRKLGNFRMAVVLGPKHPKWNGRLTYTAWLKSEHIQLLPSGQPEIGSRIDKALVARGDRRDVRLRVAYLSNLAELLESNSVVSSLPEPTARWLIRKRKLRILPHPLRDLSLPSVRLTWHAAQHQDAGHRWFRTIVAEHVAGFLSDHHS